MKGCQSLRATTKLNEDMKIMGQYIRVAGNPYIAWEKASCIYIGNKLSMENVFKLRIIKV